MSKRLVMKPYGRWIKGQPGEAGWYFVANNWNREGCVYYVAVPIHNCLEILRYKKVTVG